MAKKEKDFHLKFANIVRIGIFLFVFFWLIGHLSKNSTPSINSNLISNFCNYIYTLVPGSLKQKITDLPNIPAVKGASWQFNNIRDQAISLPQKITKDIKIEVAKFIYQSIIGE